MDARPAPYPDYHNESSQIADAYRVTLWEQPERPPDIDRPRAGWSPLPSAPMGWHEMTFDLVAAQDVREAIEWAEAKLASGEGPLSEDGVRVQDREYVIFAKAPRDDRWLQVAGWNPTRPPDRLNLRRLRRDS